jgi:Mg-chelatase subunit ChlD
MFSLKKRIILKTFLLIAPIAFFPPASIGASVTVHASRVVDTLGRNISGKGPDTLGVTLRYFAEGSYDTLRQIDTLYDTSRVPLDIVLSLDLSTSMALTDTDADGGGTKAPRVVWAKLAALGFLDSLKTGDRVSVMGWTAVGNPAGLADTANTSRYYQKWLLFSANFDSVRAFIRDSLFIDSTKWITGTYEGQILTVRNNIPNGQFTSTPMRISSVVAAQRLSRYGRGSAKRAVIMLTDGENNDGLARSVATACLDSLRRTQGQQFHAIGFVSGDTAELRALTVAGGGNCYNAVNRRQLDSVYAALASELVKQKIDTTFSTVRIVVLPDTLRQPVDVLLAIDLSSSMDLLDGTSRERIAWAKIAALGFLDSLQPQDRVAVLGWTSSIDGSIHLADTASDSLYYQKWRPYTSDLDSVRAFIRDSLFLDATQRFCDTLDGKPLVLWDDIPGGEFGYTPLHMASVMAMSYLSKAGRREANKVAIMLTDGINNDGEPLAATVAFVDSLRRTQGLQLHTIGFVGGDTAELRALSLAGGGNFYNAKDNAALLNAYASLAHQMVVEKLAARKLTVQEVLRRPPLYFMAGTQKSTLNSTVGAESMESFTDGRGYTVLRWYFRNIPVWGTAEVFYKVVAMESAAIGVDSAHAGNGFYSQMVFTDDSYQTVAVNLKQSGSDPQVGVVRRSIPALNNFIIKPDGTIRIALNGKLHGKLMLYDLSGRLAYSADAKPLQSENCVLFIVPKFVPTGTYAACFVFEGAAIRKVLRLMR